MAGRRTDALGALRWALDTGVAPVLITSALAGSLRNLGKYLEFQDSRMRAADLARAVGVPHWMVKDLARQASTWSPGAVARAIGGREGGRRSRAPSRILRSPWSNWSCL